jgi:hypothetical protein
MAVLVIALAAPLVGGLAAASCTTFNGLTVPSDASTGTDTTFVDDGPARETASEGATEAAPEAGPPPPGYLSLADAARVCTLVFSCPDLASSVLASVAVPVDPVNYSLCVHWLSAPMPPDRVGFAVQSQTFSCMAQGGSCAGAGSCLSLENVEPNDPRCVDAGADAAEHCGDDGGTVFRCADGYLLHCGSAYYAPGSTCTIGSDGSHWCAIGTNCSVAASCIGTLFDYCGDPSNLHESVNCAYDGYTCDLASNDDSGLPGCNTGTLIESCDVGGATCSGTTVEVCDGYDDSEFDCAAIGQSCTAATGPAICAGPNDACTPFDSTVNVCNGSTLSLCVGGQKQQLDCTSLGMTCIAGSGPQSGHCG